MFGTNVITKQSKGPVTHYRVHSLFTTIQGEGPLSGMPAVFVRMAGCNLRCYWCDTEFDEDLLPFTPDQLLHTIADLSPHGRRIVVFTGGEPMLQPLGPVVQGLLSRGLIVQYETAGTVWDYSLPSYGGDLRFVCSPKTGQVHTNIANACYTWKYIVAAGTDKDPEDGLPIYSTQIASRDGAPMPGRVYRPPYLQSHPSRIWVQPRAEYHRDGTPDRERTDANVQHAVGLCDRYGYRLSLQTHKMIGLP